MGQNDDLPCVALDGLCSDGRLGGRWTATCSMLLRAIRFPPSQGLKFVNTPKDSSERFSSRVNAHATEY